MTDKPKVSTVDTPNLWQRISAVRAETTSVEKDMEVGYGDNKYAASSHEAVNNMLRPLMVKHGLVDYLSPVDSEVIDTGVKYGSKNPRPLFQLRNNYHYVVVNIDNPDEQLSIPVTGWGEDAGDKGPGKASTYAFKEGRKKLFSVSSGDAEEARIDESKIMDQRAIPVTPEQIDMILHKADMLFGDKAEGKVARMCEKCFNVVEVREIPRSLYDQVINLLQNQYDRESKASTVDTEKSDD